MEHRLEGLEQVHDQNTKTLLECYDTVEARQWMIMRAMDDLMAGCAKGLVLEQHEGKDDGVPVMFIRYSGIDWNFYKDQYIAFVKEQEAKRVAEEAKAAEPEAQAEFPEDAVIFGGDHG